MKKTQSWIRTLVCYCLALAMVLTLALPLPAEAASEQKILSVNVHMGDYAESGKTGVGANLSFAGKTGGDATVSVRELPQGTATRYTLKGNQEGTPHYDRFEYKSNGMTNGYVFTYTLEMKNLKAETSYGYEISLDGERVQGQFTTGLPAKKAGHVRFAFLGDPQVADEKTGKATGALFHYLSELSKDNPLNFVYIAGDHTDRGYEDQTKINKKTGKPFGQQWEDFFNNTGLYPNATQNFLLSHLLLSTQGNHDEPDFNGRINVPDPILKPGVNPEYAAGVYSVVQGPVKFIILNDASYNVDNLANNESFERMMTYFEKEVKSAKEAGLWTIVGFHKPLYTGATHLTDKDVIAFRKLMNPRLAKAGVDMVLCGHDHVYTRGFIDAKGVKQTVIVPDQKELTFRLVDGAPFHMTPEHAGGLKWYKANKDYLNGKTPIEPDDPLLPNYEFLDKNGATEVPPTDQVQETGAVIVDINEDRAEFTCWKLKYDMEQDKLTKAPYIYDQFTILRKDDKGQQPGSNPVVVPGEEEKPGTNVMDKVNRIGGANRVETALKLSAQAYQKADRVLLARDDDFADALAASVYANLLKAPLLLTHPKELAAGVSEEISRLGAKEVILVGGKSAISDAVAQAIEKNKVEAFTRLAGKNRFETACLLAQACIKLNPELKGAILASGENYPDALCAGPLAIAQKKVLLLTGKDQLPAITAKIIQDEKLAAVTIVGEKSAVAAAPEAALSKLAGVKVNRIGGETRFETSALIAAAMPKTKQVVLATGEGFADALVVGAWAGSLPAPILLSGVKALPASIAIYLKSHAIEKATVVGGPSALSDAVVKEVAGLLK